MRIFAIAVAAFLILSTAPAIADTAENSPGKKYTPATERPTAPRHYSVTPLSSCLARVEEETDAITFQKRYHHYYRRCLQMMRTNTATTEEAAEAEKADNKEKEKSSKTEQAEDTASPEKPAARRPPPQTRNYWRNSTN